jgi:excisionase family DNA binding protein
VKHQEGYVDEHHDYLKVPEVAENLQVARSRAYELVADDEIPAIKIGRIVRAQGTRLLARGVALTIQPLRIIAVPIAVLVLLASNSLL